jgi:GT2 family glycosyltransferase
LWYLGTVFLVCDPEFKQRCDQEDRVTPSFSVIIPTKDRHKLIKGLLDSIKRLNGLDRIRPEIIVGDNTSKDETWEVLQEEAEGFPVPLRLLQVSRAGKSAVLNEAIRVATGDILLFVDDDVVPEAGWLEAVEGFFLTDSHKAAQGKIGIHPSDNEDPEIERLIERYRTIPQFEDPPAAQKLYSLNGANFAVARKTLQRIGGFNERLGPGASGTSEDVDLARRLVRSGVAIGYIPDAVVYHRVDRARLSEDYFRHIHRLQGKSRLIIKDRTIGHIMFELGRVAAQYVYHSIVASERTRYRSKGRVYHYLGMLEAKRNGHRSE